MVESTDLDARQLADEPLKYLRPPSKPAYQWPLAVVIGLVLFWILAFSGSQPTAKTVVGQILQADDFNAAPDIFETALVAMEAQVDLGNGVVATAQTFN